MSSEDEGPADKRYWRTSAAVTTQSELQSAAIHQPHGREDMSACVCVWEGAPSFAVEPVHPSVTRGMQNMGCMLGPGTCLPLPDHGRLWPKEGKMVQ